MKKLSLLGLSLLSTLTLAACSQESTKVQTPTVANVTSSETSETTSTSVDTSVNTEFRQKFDTISVGDSSNAGEGGSSMEEIKTLLGEPTSTTSAEVNNQATEELSWVDGNTTIAVGFIDGKVVSKAITGFLFNREKTISLTNFNELAEGTSYADVLAVWGEPDAYTESNILGSKSVGATWFSNIKGNDVTANAFLVFTDDTLAQKSQTGLTN